MKRFGERDIASSWRHLDTIGGSSAEWQKSPLPGISSLAAQAADWQLIADNGVELAQ